MVHVNDCKPEDVETRATSFFLAVTPCLQRLKHSDGLVVAEELFTGGQPRPGDIVSFEVEPRKDASDRKSDCVCVCVLLHA